MNTTGNSPNSSSLNETNSPNEHDIVLKSDRPPGRFIYDRHEMLEIYLYPLSKVRPDYLSEEFDEIASQDEQGVRKLWKPDLWIKNLWAAEKKSTASSSACTATNTTATNANSGNMGSRTNFRPLRHVHNNQKTDLDSPTVQKRGFKSSESNKDNSGIILCPQRRSFVGGCHAPASVKTSSTTTVGCTQDRQPPSVLTTAGGAIAAVPNAATSRQRRTSFVDATAPMATSQRRWAGVGGSGSHGKLGSGTSENWRDKNARNAPDYDSRRRWTGVTNTSSVSDRSASSGGGSTSSYNDHQQHHCYSNQNKQHYHRGPTSAYYDRNGPGGTDSQARDLPEWATEGPLDMHDTIELRGFDDENDDASGVADGSKKNWLGAGGDVESEWQNVKRPNLNTNSEISDHHEAMKDREDKDRKILSAVNKEAGLQQSGLINFDKPIGDVIPSGSRFSKFFAGSTNHSIPTSNIEVKETHPNSNNRSATKATENAIPEKRISASVLLAGTASVNAAAPVTFQEQEDGSSRAIESLNSRIPAGAMNLEDLEAILCQRTKSPCLADKKLTNGISSSNPALTPSASNADLRGRQVLLQELFRSADKAAKGTAANKHPSTEMDGLAVPAYMTSATGRPYKFPSQKGDPLSDPGQQQQLLDALSKLHSQQQTKTSDESSAGSCVMPPNVTMPQLAGLPNLPTQLTPSAPYPIPVHLPLLLPHQQLALHPALLQQNVPAQSGPKLSPVPGSNAQEALLTAAALTQQGSFFTPSAGSVGQSANQELLFNAAQLAYQKAMLNKKMLEEHQQQLLQIQTKKLPNTGQPQQLANAGVQEPSVGDSGDYAGSTANRSINVSAFTPTSVLKQMRCATPSKSIGAAVSKNTDPTSASSASSTLSWSPPRVSKSCGSKITQSVMGQSTNTLQCIVSAPQAIPAQLGGNPQVIVASTSAAAPHALSGGPHMIAGTTTNFPPPANAAAEVLRLLAQQQQRQQQLVRAQQQQQQQQQQQWQIMQQQMGAAAAMLPRLMGPTGVGPISGDEYQQMLGMALLQQQQQQQQHIKVAGNAAADIIRQRAFLAATFQQQQAHLVNAIRQPNLGALYIRRRSQLLHENSKKWAVEGIRRDYLQKRAEILAERYGYIPSDGSSKSRSVSIRSGSQITLEGEEVTRKAVTQKNSTCCDAYEFEEPRQTLETCQDSITRLRFAHDEKYKLAISSMDGTISVIHLSEKGLVLESVLTLKGHLKGVVDIAWSVSNDLLLSCSLDATLRLWDPITAECLRIVEDTSAVLCCIFQPVNNNLVVTGTCRTPGAAVCMCCDNSGRLLWVGDDKVMLLDQ